MNVAAPHPFRREWLRARLTPFVALAALAFLLLPFSHVTSGDGRLVVAAAALGLALAAMAVLVPWERATWSRTRST